MKNPYEILDVNQDATAHEITKAVIDAMRQKKHSSSEVAKARAVLSRPSSRLAADITFPVFPATEEFEEIKANIKSKGLKLDEVDPDKYDSL